MLNNSFRYKNGDFYAETYLELDRIGDRVIVRPWYWTIIYDVHAQRKTEHNNKIFYSGQNLTLRDSNNSSEPRVVDRT